MGTLYEADLVANFVIDALFESFNQQLKFKRLGSKFAPVTVNKEASFTFQALVIMESKCLQAPDAFSEIQSNRNIQRDTLAVNNITKKITAPPRKLSTLDIRSTTKHRNKSSLSSKTVYENQHKIFIPSKNFNMNNSIKDGMQKLIEKNDNKDKKLDQEIEQVKSHKFFIEQAELREKARIDEKMRETHSKFESKVSKFKKISDRFSYDYEGETIEAHLSQNKPISVHEIKPGFVAQIPPKKQINVNKLNAMPGDKINIRKVMSSSSKPEQGSRLDEIKSSLGSHKMIGQAVDPITQLNDNLLSEGIKITSANMIKQKFRKRLQNRLKTLQEYRNSTKQINFKQFTIVSNKSRSKTVTQEDLFSDKNLQQLTQDAHPIQKQSETMNVVPCITQDHKKRVKSENISLTNSRIRNSILYSSTLKNTTNHGTINVGNLGLYEQICTEQQQQ